MSNSNFHLTQNLHRFPEQRLTRQEALRGNLTSYRILESLIYLFPGMTIDPAYASFTETTLGSLEVGKLADFTVFSQNIMTVAVDEILATTVDATVIDGIPVYGTI
jgi:predicted amidohydrolase YtcJ